MAYKALYREWRPKDFQEVVGQDHISVTLQNAIGSGRVAHAYLFSGPRGTGKTSSAKILAKALNCITGPTPKPCNQCEACHKINQGISLDVMEIDAASNRGIDEIRDLREKVKFAPSEGRYKVYIIDEVHMLTTEAFNALLKTLEEPPSQVIFILATTEPHKIPSTILSRVQRFDFKRINLQDILERLKVVTEKLPGQIDEDALLLIARKAEGGMRDALSLLDQCYTLGEHLDKRSVLAVLGSLKEEEVIAICDAIANRDVLGAISLLDKLLLEGRDPGQVLKEVIEHLRNLLIIKATGPSNNLVHISSDLKSTVEKQSKLISINRLTELITNLIKAEADLRYSSQARITLEVAFISACSDESDVPVVATIGRENQTDQYHQQKQVIDGTFRLEKHNETPTQSNNLIKAEELNIDNNDSSKLNLDQIKREWKRLLDSVKKAKIGTYAFLVESSPISINEGILVLGFRECHTFHRDKIAQPENKTVVEQALFNLLGYQIGVKCIITGENTYDTNKEDLVSQTVQIFGEELVEIKE